MSNDKMREAIEETAYFIEALDYSAENDAQLSKLRSALSQQPEHPTADRPTEPRCEDEDPEQWCRVLKWEEDRGDYWEAVAKSQLPEGWKAVPIDPDLKQLEAGQLAAKFVEVDISLNALAVIYAEMRAAAPPIPEPQP